MENPRRCGGTGGCGGASAELAFQQLGEACQGLAAEVCDPAWYPSKELDGRLHRSALPEATRRGNQWFRLNLSEVLATCGATSCVPCWRQ